ncbi:MAG: hypothetical protein HAW67_07490 [Endozoicomonadaceae bacterium]|nr:hypothetical protein [Endozoicomonadaceae bacterium]
MTDIQPITTDKSVDKVQPSKLSIDDFTENNKSGYDLILGAYKIEIYVDSNCRAPDVDNNQHSNFITDTSDFRGASCIPFFSEEGVAGNGEQNNVIWYELAIDSLLEQWLPYINRKSMRGIGQLRTAIDDIIAKANMHSDTETIEDNFGTLKDASNLKDFIMDYISNEFSTDDGIKFIEAFDEVTVLKIGTFTSQHDGSHSNFMRFIDFHTIYNREDDKPTATAQKKALRILANDAKRNELMEYIESETKESRYWFNGEVYGYLITTLAMEGFWTQFAHCEGAKSLLHELFPDTDSCRGYYGLDDIIGEIDYQTKDQPECNDFRKNPKWIAHVETCDNCKASMQSCTQ